ncbi:MAG TPA: carotenoid oxygenase family protein [Chloroflexia bacterium]|nr:carotenoid oxygenase family protein [Chloroflexia bacterium]
MLATTYQNFTSRPGYTSLYEEVSGRELPVKGRFPDWLKGTLLRNGPARFEAGEQRVSHWFDGFAMLSRFSFDQGRVSYTNKFVQTPILAKANQSGQLQHTIFSAEPAAPFRPNASNFAARHLDNPNVNIQKIGSRYLALGETVPSAQVDPGSLETLGIYEFPDSVAGQTTTAHPLYDPSSGFLYNFTTHFSRVSSYNIYYIQPGAQHRTLLASLPVAEPAYMHSFSLTERYLVLAEYPFTVNPLRLLTSGKPFMENFEWKAAKGTRFILIDKQTGKLVGSYTTGAFFSFHHINAFEAGENIYLDLTAYSGVTSLYDLKLDKLRGLCLEDSSRAVGEFRRYRLPMRGQSVDYEVVSDHFIELPRLNPAQTTRSDYRFAYGIGSDGDSIQGLHNRLFKINVASGQTEVWHEPDQFPGEPVFVAAPQAQTEDNGVILSVVLDGLSETSYLLVLDAASFEEIARASLPHHLPFGFHGEYFKELF